MASSGKSSRNKPDLAARVAARLEDIVKLSDRLVAGLSGGVDSVVLLDVLARVARKRRCRLAALHVNHQLSPNARRWEAFCRRLCRARGIPFRSARIEVRRGDGIEAAARAARYAVFARQRCEYVVLAHHRDDQVETLLLQLLRGAGVKGLAAMPLLRTQDPGLRIEGRQVSRRNSGLNPQSSIHNPRILRPLLDATREEILEYAKKRGLQWIEDESNQDRTFLRNFVRHEVLPVIARRFPAYRTTLARAAGNLADAAQALDELAATDAAGELAGPTLSIAALRQLLAARRDAHIVIGLGDFELRRFDDRLHLVPARRNPPQRFARRWRGETELAVPELGGVLILSHARGEGISVARLGGRPVTIEARRGGERIQPDCRRPRRTLKNLLQEARVPTWERERLPVIRCAGKVVWVPGVGVDCEFQAKAEEAAVRPAWTPGS